MDLKYVEIGEIRINDKYYSDDICQSLRKGGFETALIFDGIGEQSIRILREKKE